MNFKQIWCLFSKQCAVALSAVVMNSVSKVLLLQFSTVHSVQFDIRVFPHIALTVVILYDVTKPDSDRTKNC